MELMSKEMADRLFKQGDNAFRAGVKIRFFHLRLHDQAAEADLLHRIAVQDEFDQKPLP